MDSLGVPPPPSSRPADEPVWRGQPARGHVRQRPPAAQPHQDQDCRTGTGNHFNGKTFLLKLKGA